MEGVEDEHVWALKKLDMVRIRIDNDINIRSLSFLVE